jgi:hypothetical protein
MGGLFWFSTCSPLAVFFTHVALHRTLFKSLPANQRIRVCLNIILGVTALWEILALVAFASAPIPIYVANVAYVLCISAGLGFCYFIFFTMSETARRIRILVDVYVAEQTEYEAVAYNNKAREEYNAQAMIDVRIERLTTFRAIHEKEGKLVPTFSLLLLASKLIHLWRNILFGKSVDGRTSRDWNHLSKAS